MYKLTPYSSSTTHTLPPPLPLYSSSFINPTPYTYTKHLQNPLLPYVSDLILIRVSTQLHPSLYVLFFTLLLLYFPLLLLYSTLLTPPYYTPPLETISAPVSPKQASNLYSRHSCGVVRQTSTSVLQHLAID